LSGIQHHNHNFKHNLESQKIETLKQNCSSIVKPRLHIIMLHVLALWPSSGISHKIIHILYTYSIEQSPSWEANSLSDSQETPRILWYPKVHYHVYKYLPPLPILNHLDPVHAPISHFNIILPSKPGSPKWSLTLSFPHQTPVYTSPLPIRATCLAHLILLDLITRRLLGEE
jgi:hypothetical protein